MRVTLPERPVSGALGAFFGALIGVAVGWVLVMGGRHGIGSAEPGAFRQCALAGAAIFGVAGLASGGDAGGIVGSTVGLLLSPDSDDDRDTPRWFGVVVIVCTVVAVWWFVRGR